MSGERLAGAPVAWGRNRVYFGEDPRGGELAWVATRAGAAERLAGAQSGHELYLRLWFAAISRTERTGHARFERGDLVTLVLTDHDTGERRGHDNTVEPALRKAVRLGLLDPISCRECLVVVADLNQRGNGKTSPCGLAKHAGHPGFHMS